MAGKIFNMQTNDAVDVFVKFGKFDGLNSVDFKFHVYDSEYKNVKTLTCDMTVKMKFVALF